MIMKTIKTTKNRSISSLLCFALLLLLCTIGITASAVPSFTDVPEDAWYAESVDYAVSNGLFSGTTATTFSPEEPMTRAMFVTALGRMSGVGAESIRDNKVFSDVDFNSWYGPYVIWAYKNGLVNGTSDTTFSPEQNITREQIAMIISNYLDTLNVQLPADENTPSAFTDEASISPWAMDAVAAMRKSGFMQGNNNAFEPQKTLSRAEAATVLMRLHKFLETGSAQPETSVEKVMPAGVTVAESKVTLAIGKTYTISAYVAPSSAADKALTYKTSNTTVARVDQGGTVTAVREGTAVITITTVNGKTATCTINVTDGTVPVTDISLNKDSLTITEGGNEKLVAILTPAEASEADISWDSTNPAVAAVDKNGLVTGVKSGTATITAWAGNKTATCKVTVSKPSSSGASFSLGFAWEQNVDTIAFETSDVNGLWEDGYVAAPSKAGSIYEKGSLLEEISVFPTFPSEDDIWMLDGNGSVKKAFLPDAYSFSSSDTSVIQVNSHGEVTNPVMLQNGESTRTATITVTCKADGSFINIPVTIGNHYCYTLDDEYVETVQDEIFRLMNIERENAGLEPLEYIYEAQCAADLRAEEFSIQPSHTRPDGTNFNTVQKDFDLGGAFHGENGNVYGFDIMESPEDMAQGMMDKWMASSGHRANIMSNNYKTIAIGVCFEPVGEAGVSYTAYAIQLFSRAPASYFE